VSVYAGCVVAIGKDGRRAFRLLIECIADGAECGGNVLHHEGRGQSHHADAPPVNPLVPHGVVGVNIWFIMDAAVYLDRQIALYTVEVWDKGSD